MKDTASRENFSNCNSKEVSKDTGYPREISLSLRAKGITRGERCPRLSYPEVE